MRELRRFVNDLRIEWAPQRLGNRFLTQPARCIIRGIVRIEIVLLAVGTHTLLLITLDTWLLHGSPVGARGNAPVGVALDAIDEGAKPGRRSRGKTRIRSERNAKFGFKI